MRELQQVLKAVREGLAGHRRMALATIVAVQGSTYRREGARLLVPDGGPTVGTISGGCLEGDVQVAAEEVMRDGEPRLLRFDLTADDENVWGWGLGCNGIVDVFVEPAEMAAEAGEAIARAIEEHRPLAVVTAVESEAGDVRPGARMLVHPDGHVDGGFGSESVDRVAAQEAGRRLAEERSGIVPIEGVARVFVEAVVPPPRLLVCGAGHDAAPLVAGAAGLGWRVEVVDDRPVFLSPDRFPEASGFVHAEPRDAADAAGTDERTYVVVMSHNFLRDRDYLRSFLGTPVPYIGMLGPAARLDRLLAALRTDGLEPGPADLAVVHGPAGLDLGGDGPHEVAHAILAEILAVRNDRTGGFLRDRSGPIHGRSPGRSGVISDTL